MLFVVGTGRCGTYSIAKAFEQMGYDSHHERWASTTVQGAYWYVTQRLSSQAAGDLMQSVPWGQVEVDSKLSELVPILTQTHPDAKFLWVWRDPQKVAESMTRRGWYQREDDYLPPFYYAGWQRNEDAQMVMFLNLNHAGHRTKGWEVSDIPSHEWNLAEQWDKCRWFIDYISFMLETHLPADHRKIDIETVTPQELEEIAGWAFPDQPPAPLDEIPNERVEDAVYRAMFGAAPTPRTDTLREDT